MKTIMIGLLVSIASLGYSQTTETQIPSADTRVRWLGVDFSHVKLIGEFSHFNGVGDKSIVQLKERYFPAWNKLILNEREKYDIKGMLRRDKMIYDVDMIFKLNANAALEELESYNTPEYSKDEITKFISGYDTNEKDGVGAVLIAETLNKSEQEAYFHFVVINMSDKKILVHQRLRGEPGGFGLRNYWAGAIYDVMKQISENARRSPINSLL
jgi:hypothetical protein